MDAQPEPAGSESFGQLLDPEYWLIFGLEWTGDAGMAEAAYAVAPGVIPRHMLGEDARQILECADLYVRKRGGRAIFFSDLTRMFASSGEVLAGPRRGLGGSAGGASVGAVSRAVPDDLAASARVHLRRRDPAHDVRAGRQGGSDRVGAGPGPPGARPAARQRTGRATSRASSTRGRCAPSTKQRSSAERVPQLVDRVGQSRRLAA